MGSRSGAAASSARGVVEELQPSGRAGTLEVVYHAVDRLTGYEKNARTHSEAQVDQIAASIREFGWTNPVLVDSQLQVIAGHGRLIAAQKMGMAEVPTIEISGLSDDQRRALIIADNKLALNAGWDDELLAFELGELKGSGFDLDVIGFAPLELDSIFAKSTSGLTDPDDVPEPPAEPVTKLGDVWLLGRHRIVCGDSTDEAVVRLCLAGGQAQMIFTDPPYGVDYTGGMKKRERLSNDNIGTDIYESSLRHLEFAADDHAALYLWYADGHAAAAAAAAAAAGYQIVAQVIWAKNHAQFMTSAHYKGKHEPCFYAHRRGKKVRWHGPNNEVTLWECNRSPRNDYHPTQKPVELAERAIRNSSALSDIVLDLFLGGGTTLIASESTGRRCLAVELNPAYVDVAVVRWQEFTGENAVHAETGRTFSEERSRKEQAHGEAAETQVGAEG